MVSPSAASIGVKTSCCSDLSFRLLRLRLNATSTLLPSTYVCRLSMATAPEASFCAIAEPQEAAPIRHEMMMRVNELVFIMLIRKYRSY